MTNTNKIPTDIDADTLATLNTVWARLTAEQQVAALYFASPSFRKNLENHTAAANGIR